MALKNHRNEIEVSRYQNKIVNSVQKLVRNTYDAECET